MGNWRPDNWSKCPCDECDGKVIDDYGYFCDLACGERTAWLNREAGADAILKALRNGGIQTDTYTWIDWPPLAARLKLQGRKGHIVFIEEAEE